MMWWGWREEEREEDSHGGENEEGLSLLWSSSERARANKANIWFGLKLTGVVAATTAQRETEGGRERETGSANLCRCRQMCCVAWIQQWQRQQQEKEEEEEVEERLPEKPWKI